MSFHVFLLVLLSVSMHAAWNLLSKKTMPSASFFCISSFAAAICWTWAIPVAGVPETALSTLAIKLWILSFCCETLYFIGLFKAYAATDISLAYPVVRALPVLMVAALTAIIYPGHYPSNWGITGLLTVCCGCLLMPLKKFSDFSWRNYTTAAMGWILLAAAGSTGFTLADSELMKIMAASPRHNAMTAAYILSFAVNGFLVFSMGLLVVFRPAEYPIIRAFFSSWKNFIAPVCAGILSSLAYLLILIAMTQVTHLSFLQAFRQMSLPLGLILGIVILKEPAHPPKILGITTIVIGLVVIAQLG